MKNFLMTSLFILFATLFATLFVTAFATSARANIDIPQSLSKADRETSLRILGFGTSNKILSDPYPLGGYSGLEFGLSVSDFPTDALKNLGSKTNSVQNDVAYSSLSVGKGLYNNLDVFLNFTPYLQSVQMSQLGAQIRWSFYQAETLPFSMSVLFTGNSSNISNRVTVRTIGADIIGGLNVNRVALYSGVGSVQSSGEFVGGSRGLTDSGYQESESVMGLHLLLGINIRLSDFFLSAEADHYQDTVFSGKFGLRL